MVSAVVFDMDGVLLDSEAAWDAAREAYTREAGGGWSESAQRDMMGMSSTEWSRYMHEELGVPADPEQISSDVVERMVASYHERLPTAQNIPIKPVSTQIIQTGGIASKLNGA